MSEFVHLGDGPTIGPTTLQRRGHFGSRATRCVDCSTPPGIRTPNLLIKSQLL